MRAFIVLCFLATSVCGQLLGYNYGVGQTGQLGLGNGYQLINNNGGLGNQNLGGLGLLNSGSLIGSQGNLGGLGSFSSGGLIGSQGNLGGSVSYNSGGLIGSQGLGGLNGGNIAAGYGGSLSYSNNNNGLIGGGQDQSFVEAPVEVEESKEFYIFEAPEQDYQQEHAQNLNQAKSSIKKHQNVIFIKTPENKGFEKAAVSLARNAVETKSAIYILHKQADISALANKLVTVNTLKAAQPEVHFIKYNTAQDAINAQRTIQAQYESLGGSTVFKNGGVPRVLNFATNYAPAFMTPSYSVGQSGGIVSSGSLLGSGGIIGNGGIVSSGGGISTGGLDISASNNIGSVSTGGLVSTGDTAATQISSVKVNGPSQQYLPSSVKK